MFVGFVFSFFRRISKGFVCLGCVGFWVGVGFSLDWKMRLIFWFRSLFGRSLDI